MNHDIRLAFRQLVRRPGFTVISVIVLALGIGAATAIFSILDTLVFRALPYADGDRLVTIWENNTDSGLERDDVAPANYFSWAESAQSFQEIAAFDPYSLDLTGVERPEVLFAARVTEDFFRVLDAGVLHGRTFVAEDFEAGNVVVIGEDLWTQRFGAAPDLVGQTIELDGDPYRVVGVVPREFNPYFHPTVAARDAWIPLVPQGWERTTRGSRWWNVVARLAPGVSVEAARAEMAAISSQLAVDFPDTNRGIRANVVPMRNHLVGDARTALFVLQGAVLFLLLVACANVASLLMARGTERRGEFALRGALGAGRITLVRQLLTESLVIALAGCVAGVLLAYWGVQLIVAIAPTDIPRIDQVVVDVRVLWFALAAAGGTALVFGLAPALHFSRPDLQGAMKEGHRAHATAAQRRIRHGMVVAEIALSLVLVVGAGLLARSFATLLEVDPGFEGEDVSVAQLFRYADGETPEQRANFFQEALDRIRALPGVRTAGAVSAFPMIEANIAVQRAVQVVGQAVPRPEDQPNAFVAQATPGYFESMSIPLLAGRTFRDSDRASSIPVAIVTQSLARRHWDDANPIGERLYLGDAATAPDTATRTAWEIVGVVGQVRHDGLDQEGRPEVFLPHAQAPAGGMVLVARTEGDPRTLIGAIQSEVWSIDPNQTFYRTATVPELVSRSVAGRRFNLWVLSAFAGLALLLAAVGMYGVISYTARASTHEIGIRMALGAGRGDVLRQVMARGARLTAIGVALGLVGALGLTGWMSGLLYGVSPRDPLTLAAVAAVLAATALFATYLPARRATRVDPQSALREE